MQVVEYAKKNSEALELIFDANSAYKILWTENWHFATMCTGALFPVHFGNPFYFLSLHRISCSVR